MSIHIKVGYGGVVEKNHQILSVAKESNFNLHRNVLGTKKLGDILSERESIANEMQDLLREATAAWGVTVERVEVGNSKLLSTSDY